MFNLLFITLWLCTRVVDSPTTHRSDIKLISFWDVVSQGRKTASNNNLPELEEVVPRPDTPAIIMYTSGSTGNPKG
jgi:long-subunit acyl-CoA synthetase (AMP-forming)